MRKFFFLLIVVCLFFTSCDQLLPSEEEPQDQHVHTWDNGYFTVVPTCQTDGERICTCSTCGETKTEVVPASELYHVFGNGEETKPATCTKKGERLFTCELCQAQKTIETDPLGHAWDEGEITKLATEAEDGEITYKCQREGCDATMTGSYHLHKWDSGEITKDATCWVDGEIRYTCQYEGCDETKTEIIPKESAPHYFDTAWTKDQTHHWHQNTCGHVLTKDQMDGYAEHTFGEATVLVPATCTTEGTKEKACTVCGYKVTEKYTDDTQHEYSQDWTHDEDQHWHVATCEHGGTTVKEDHVWTDELTKEGSCTADGEIKHTCSVCGYSYTEVVPKEDYHDIDSATCTCKICNEVFYFQASRDANKNKVVLRSAFMNKGLTELVMPSLIPNWNYSAWYAPEVVKSVNTSTLETLTIAEGVTTIGYQAFKDKTNLHTVVLPSTLTMIDQEAFMSSGITSLHIPASVTFIGAQGLAYCTSLTDIYYDGTSSQWAELFTKASNILYGTDAIVHFND